MLEYLNFKKLKLKKKMSAVGITTDLRERGVEAARNPAALARLVLEGDLDAVDGERRAGAVCPPAVLRVELTERLNQKEAAVTLDLRAETPGDQRLNQKEAAVTLHLRADTW